MRYRILCAVVIGTAASFAPSLLAASAGVGEKHNGFSVADEQYLAAYEQAEAKGFDVGRNLLESAWSDDPPVSDERIAASTERLQAWLNPPPVPEPSTSSSSESTYTEPAPTYSGGTSSSTVMCESGGDYGANTGNGYYGGYQFDSGTWDAYGDPAYGEASEAPPAVQDAAAASVPYDAWPNC